MNDTGMNHKGHKAALRKAKTRTFLGDPFVSLWWLKTPYRGHSQPNVPAISSA